MIAIVSPAKSMNFDTKCPSETTTEPRLIEETIELANTCKKLSSVDLQSLMKISEKLGHLNQERFANFSYPFPPDTCHPALWAFQGDVYQGFDAETLNKDGVSSATTHLRMLSGLYGLLRPLDQIMPYRLEMGTSLQNIAGKNLYQFWGSSIAHLLNEDLKEHSNKTIINLASQEYFKAVQVEHLVGDLVTCDFKENKDGKIKIISFFAKKARGRMARWIVDNKPDSVDELKDFDLDDYKYSPALSKPNHLIFVR